jgi:hypothetical protein
MQRDKYVDLRIKDYALEYPQVRATSVRPGIHQRNIEQAKYPS